MMKNFFVKKNYTGIVISMVLGFVVLTVTGLGAKLMEKVPFLSKY